MPINPADWLLTPSTAGDGKPWGTGTNMAARAVASPSPWDVDCKVTTLIVGYAAMSEMRDTLEALIAAAQTSPNAPGAKGHVYITDWRFNCQRDLSSKNQWTTDPWGNASSGTNDQTALGLLLRLMQSGVAVRVLVWLPNLVQEGVGKLFAHVHDHIYLWNVIKKENDRLAALHPALAGPTSAAVCCEAEANALARKLGRLWEAAHIEKIQPADPQKEDDPTRLPPALRAFFEEHLGCDFRGVRIHHDSFSALAAFKMGARAFTRGEHLYFVPEQYDPRSLSGIRLIAHELVHVAQQGAAPRRDPAVFKVQHRSPRVVQCAPINPQAIFNFVCPPGTQPTSFPSSGPIGTGYGKWLGMQYVKDRKPDPYCIVDFSVYYKGRFGATTIFNFRNTSRLPNGKLTGDPGVLLAFVNRKVDATWRWPSRTDILDAGRNEVYEIKPLRSRDEGVQQLQDYLNELNTVATETPDSILFPGPGSREWKGGTWDPANFVLPVVGARGQKCCIHAWRDPQVMGLIVYDLVCCVKGPDDEATAEIAVTEVTGLSKPFLDSKPRFQQILDEYLPLAPTGTAYAFVVQARLFETYVLGPMARAQDAQYAKAYGLNPSPALSALVLQTFVVGHILTGPITDALYVSSGFMRPEEIAKMWGTQAAAAATAVAGAAAVGTIIVGADMFAAATVVAEVETATAGTLAAEAAGTAVVDTSTLAAATEGASVETGLLEGNIIANNLVPGAVVQGEVAAGQVVAGEALVIDNAGFVPLALGGAVPEAAAGLGQGLGMAAALVTAFIGGNAIAAPAQIAGVDGIYVAPTEMLSPKNGEIKLNAEVYWGGQQFFIIGFAVAGAGS
jgi:hypothetical protein